MAWMSYISHWFEQDDWYEGLQRANMSQVRQVGLLAAGCQPWNKDVCVANGDRFAYCATLAIYIYQLDHRYNEFKLHAIMSEHKKTITAISWCPHNPDLFASGSTDNLVIIWNVAEQKVIAKLDNTKGTPASLSWCWNADDTVAFASQRGPLFIWTISGPDSGVTVHKEAHSFLSDICIFRWHTQRKGKVVFGHIDGSLSIFQPGNKSQKHVLRPESLEGTDEEDPVTALEWDPLSTDYLLVANLHRGIRLVDSESLCCITTFNFPSAVASVQCLAWVPNAPGMFITGDSQVGVLRIWNVSRATPVDNFKLKKTGFHCFHVLNSPPRKKFSIQSPTKNHYTSSTSEAVPPPTLTQNQAFSVPPGHAVCCFLDGGVGLYDMGAKKWDFLRDLGHVETIFDCKFKPDDPNLLATASFDGTIKVWDINTLTAVYTSPGNEGVIYSLSWAPGDLNCIAGATSRNGAFIWDIKKGKIVQRFNEHGKNGIFCIAWSHRDSKRIATCSGDGSCIIRTVDGKVLHKYKHPAAVFGCDWSQNNRDMIATGCEDKNVRVYYVATSSDQPLKVFSGHTEKVFHVRWSPLREGILCSGSDDGSVRIWDYTQDACISILRGHTAPVRGLMWNTEIPYLLISGSWDYTIKVWDTREGTCLDTVYDHGADVYGLTCHPRRPFTMASCSRDSTVRLWSLTPLITPLQINILADRSWEEIIGNADCAVEQGMPPLLCGKVSRDIKQEIEKLSGNPRVKKLRWFSECLSPPGGSDNLWDLVAVIKGQDDSLLPPNYCKGIMHLKHLIPFRTSEAQELTTVKMSKFGGGIGVPTKEERLKEAAEIHLRLGQIRRYCELMVELGEWDKALSVAPGVSVKYWKKLMQRRADQLIQEDKDDVIPYCIAIGDVKKLVHFFMSRGQLKEALLVAQAACEGDMQTFHVSTPKGSSYSDDIYKEDFNELLQEACRELAEWYFQDGRAVLAACCHLAVDNIELAMAYLIRGNELELAVCVGTVLGELAGPATHYALELLARKCMIIPTCFPSTGYRNLAVDLLLMTPDSELQLVKLCAFYPGCIEEINDLHEKCKLPTVEECMQLAETAHADGNIFETIKYYLLSQEPEKALPIGIDFIKEYISSSNWTLDTIYPVLDLLSYVRTEKLVLHTCTKARNELLILCGYVGALLAIRRQYQSIVPALYEYTSQLLKCRKVSVPIKIEHLSEELDAWRACTQSVNRSSEESPYTPPSDSQRMVYATLLKRLKEEPLRGIIGPDYVTGSNLPSHFDSHISCLTGLKIQGPVFFLEDGKSTISLNEALMWAKVNPFSPLGTGIRLNPF
ncbi:WD repeat-containing protein 17 isoform X1 [Physeter macrocephalus]|uniref:WD repeat-containing protein 17 isoform X1 n=3 Tax=Physeter macrocephalus TaxID=9755 RepID=A0A455ALX9_PHYMC|nr:WD repeat-containing protein 17 isoform X1 [Physeter catodon]XP_028336963.1 WD repeat-containing protein 17 isoform X1 [Physeter catodon]XP_028336964.1 WD repeat-containing protein 17 isoform X1 [Physeter catodon]|eukprot:XP_028336962.1 WD repeat-containing protein 17 isoform X1 [Physeter catodon]